MNRRGFFSALAATALVASSRFAFAQTSLSLVDDPIDRYVQHLIDSMTQTKETLTASILNKAFPFNEQQPSA